MKSTPYVKPLVKIDMSEITIRRPETMYAIFFFPRKSTVVFWRKFLVSLLSNVTFLPFDTLSSKLILVMKKEVRTEVMIPMISVVANPCTGPEPNTKSTIPVRRVVI